MLVFQLGRKIQGKVLLFKKSLHGKQHLLWPYMLQVQHQRAITCSNADAFQPVPECIPETVSDDHITVGEAMEGRIREIIHPGAPAQAKQVPQCLSRYNSGKSHSFTQRTDSIRDGKRGIHLYGLGINARQG
ncbi:hypothetical protein DCC81_18850 [Chitinophaga parva]|uniref:Uncharacterized protein n=1 Tax=Chitinophaga parva TaxID=2169414 RepID=A0A2T7BJ47_9BACT|nr:hypothetical protein DCC81_18850 [Chitinophaga parva]